MRLTEPLLLVAVAAAHVAGVHRAWRSAGPGRVVSRSQAAAFLSGTAVAAVAVVGPVASGAGESLAVHMVQHVLLLAVAAPLLAAGAPLVGLLWALPARARLASRPVWRGLARSHGRRWGTWVGVAIILQTGAMWVWHLPVAYDAAVRNGALHAAEHASFVGAATLLWWTVTDRRSRRGAGVVAVFVAALPAAVLGAGMTLAEAPWYGWYAARPGDALGDQQLAGVVMWGFGGAAAVVAAVVLALSWLTALERRSPGDVEGREAAAHG